MEEWISHHLLLEGFDALVLLDNGSTDRSAAVANATAAALNRTSDVHVLNAAARSRQSVHYNAAMPLLRSLADVALVADLDEFLYSADGTTAADHLRAAFSQPVAQITLPMLRFGSSGHAKQPPSIRKGFVHRRREHPAEDALFGSRKSAVRLASTLLFVVHVHQVFGETVAWDAGGPVRLNHYRIQSREFFGTVKMGRGDVAGLDRTAGRDWGYFEREDYRDVVDTGLKDKVEAWERRGGR
ncbi:hypothetical protein DFJ74DRAFT_686235 [Hyaloraphidium curvatum]|nr:hypothetical protein DFJ74DRAFT_686235 [Hyaloraphidium curvatum]